MALDIKNYYKTEELYNTILRRISSPLFKAILKTNLTANNMSFFWIFFYLLVIISFSIGSYGFLLIAILSKFLGDIFDTFNGGIARCKKYPPNKLAKGDYLENVVHHIFRPYLILAISYGLYAFTSETELIFLGFVSALNSNIIELTINDKRNAKKIILKQEKIGEIKSTILNKIITETYLLFFSIGLIIFVITNQMKIWLILMTIYSIIYLISKIFYDYKTIH